MRRVVLPPLVEMLLALAVVASFVHTVLWFGQTGYLPQPFVLDTNDTFMDWFNTAFWANRPGAYDVWRSIYPPLSFVFLDLFSQPGCYLGSPFHARDCDLVGRATIFGFYILDIVLVWIALRRNHEPSAPPRTIAFALGLPVLFALERGNLVLVCLAAFVIAYGNVTRSRTWRAVATAVTINFKPYLLVPTAAHAIARDWRALEWAGIATVGLYLVTLALVGGGTPSELVGNTVNWVAFLSSQLWNDVNYATSYAPLLTLIQSTRLPILQFIPSRTVEAIAFAAPLAIHATQLLAALCIAGAWLQKDALSPARLAALLLGAYLVTQSPGGYTQTFLLFLVLLEPWRGAGPKLAIVCAYLLCLVADWPLSVFVRLHSESWLSGQPVSPAFGLTAGQLLRPGLILVLVWALCLDSLARIVRAHRDRRPSLALVPA